MGALRPRVEGVPLKVGGGREDTTFSHYIPVTDISPGKSEVG